jgi:hypothetical protein
MAEVELVFELYRTIVEGATRWTSRPWVANLRHAGEDAKRVRDAIELNCEAGWPLCLEEVSSQAFG